MKKLYKALHKYRFALISFLIVLAGASLNFTIAQNDNVKPFQKRVGTPQPPSGVFNIKGDYTLIGNTNLTLQNYTGSANNSNNVMVYVDVDDVPQTLNSSSANLVLSEENGADPSCSEILYAGLYWSGRATPRLGNTFSVTKGVVDGSPQQVNNQSQTLTDGQSVNFTDGYTVLMSRHGGGNNRYIRYTFSGTGDSYQFQWDNSGSNQIGYRVGTSGDFIPVQGLQITTNNNNSISTATFTPISIEIDGVTFSVNRLTRDPRTNNSMDVGSNVNTIRLNANGTFIPQIPNTVQFDKRKVKFKGPSASTYTEFTANQNDIYYPNGNHEDMYTAYVDVTSYVKQNGLGEYTVADIALTEGNGGSVGYYGHWGLVVVYENSKMPWRDITLFDGYSFVRSPGSGAQAVGEFNISGFSSVQNGDVNIKLGVLAGEGDRGITGDFLEIRNAANSGWQRLTHPLNSTGNFFNSSIYTPVRNANGDLVETPRSPNLLNNTGIDIAMWDVPNPNNSIIGNGQTSTRFRYGTTGDLYTIYMVAFAVDAYVPDVEGLNELIAIDGNSPGANPTLEPGTEFTYKVDIRNKGTEAVQDFELVIPLPYTASFSGDLSDIISQINFGGGNAEAPIFDPTAGSTGSIIWKINNLPLPESGDPNEVLASLTYTLKATENCFVLAQADCEAFVEVEGFLKGKGAVSQSVFNAVPLITGYNEDGTCDGEPVTTPIRIPIVNAVEWVQQNCQGENLLLEFFFCNVSAGIPVSEIRGNFPTGTRFYDGPDPINFTEFNENNSFPADGGQFYAIPPNSSECIFQFDIVVTIVTTNPDIPNTEDLTFCEGENAGNLSQYIALSEDGQASGYQLYYFTQEVGGNAVSNPLINTSSVGTVTYWVAEGPSSGCFGDRVPVTISVTPKSAAPIVKNTVECQADGTFGYEVLASPGATLLYYEDNNPSSQAIQVTPMVDLSQPGTYTVWVSQIESGSNCESPRVQVSVTVNSVPVLVVTNPEAVCEPRKVNLTDAAITNGSSGISSLTYFSDAAATQELANPNEVNVSGTYYIKAINSEGCFVIAPVVVTINPTPSSPELIDHITVCATDPIQTLDGNDAIIKEAGLIYKWYTTADGNTEVEPLWSEVGSVTYYVSAITPSGCCSPVRTAVTLTINDCNVEIIKEVDFTEIDQPRTLTYTITVSNPGSAPLSGVVVTDPLTNDTNPLDLVSGDTNNDGLLDTDEIWVYNTTFDVTQALIDSGADIVNTAFVNTDQADEQKSSAVTEIDRNATITIIKSDNGAAITAAGEVITYTITVENTGNVTLE
ncbi:hypothetical protein MM239_13120, partial [Belliella sp. DSM 111904]